MRGSASASPAKPEAAASPSALKSSPADSHDRKASHTVDWIDQPTLAGYQLPEK